MGKRIKSTGVILDASSMASAPVSPAGTVALRAKSDVDAVSIQCKWRGVD